MGSVRFKTKIYAGILFVLWLYCGNKLSSSDIQNIITFSAIMFGFLMAAVTFTNIKSYVDAVSGDYTEKAQLIKKISKMFSHSGNTLMLLILACMLFSFLSNGFDCYDERVAKGLSLVIVGIFLYLLGLLFLLYRRIVKIAFNPRW